MIRAPKIRKTVAMATTRIWEEMPKTGKMLIPEFAIQGKGDRSPSKSEACGSRREEDGMNQGIEKIVVFSP